jgi:hypothetical protein
MKQCARRAANRGNDFGNRQLAPWISLAQYCELFRANDIDGNLLQRLTGDDLRRSASRRLAVA